MHVLGLDLGQVRSPKCWHELARLWTAVMRIPLASLSAKKPESDTRWRLNLYRCDRPQGAFLAWNPTLQGSFHIPERFGILEFGR